MKHLILLHGALGSPALFDPVRRELSSHFVLHSLAFSGHAGTSFNETFFMETFVEELEDYLRQQGLEKPLVFGYSMGGYVAMSLEAKKPGTFTAIQTLATKFNWTPEGAAREAAMLDPVKMQEKVPAYASFLESLHGSQWQELVRKTAGMMQALGQKPLLGKEEFPKITCPVQIGLGDRDRMVSFEETLEAYRSLSQASLEVLPFTPHPLEKVDAPLLTGSIQRFMR